MPLRDSEGRFCGTLHRKEVDGHWDRCYFVLDEDKCLLRYFSQINAQEEFLDWDDCDGEINIRLITKIEDKSKTEDKYEGCIEIQTCSDRFYVRADTKEGAEEWIRTLRKAAVDPSKRKEDSIGREEKLSNDSTESDKDSPTDKPERICYETKIIGGVVVRTPVRKLTDSDSEGGGYSSDSLVRSGSAGVSSTIKPIKEGYLTKKGAVVKSWKKRYFKLDTLKLAYYEKASDKEPIRAIFSSEVITVRPNLGADNSRKHLFEVVTASRTFLIQGETEEEMKSWIDAIASVSPRGRSSSEPDSKTTQELLKTKYHYAETTRL